MLIVVEYGNSVLSGDTIRVEDSDTHTIQYSTYTLLYCAAQSEASWLLRMCTLYTAYCSALVYYYYYYTDSTRAQTRARRRCARPVPVGAVASARTSAAQHGTLVGCTRPTLAEICRRVDDEASQLPWLGWMPVDPVG